MLDEPRIVQSTPQLMAFVRLTVPRERIQEVMGPGLGEVKAALAAQGVAAAGPWFTHHLHNPAETFDFEICIPVNVPIAATGRVKPGQLPPRTIARTTYHGPYEKLGAAWGELEAWIAASGYTSGPDLWEPYVAGPESGPDPSRWSTELNRPVRKR